MLSPLLFVMVMEALSRSCRDGLPDELLYADDLIVVAKTRELLKERLVAWRKGLEAKGLRVNIAKTKVMRCREGGGHVREEGEDSCGVCGKGVGVNSIQSPIAGKRCYYVHFWLAALILRWRQNIVVS